MSEFDLEKYNDYKDALKMLNDEAVHQKVEEPVEAPVVETSIAVPEIETAATEISGIEDEAIIEEDLDLINESAVEEKKPAAPKKRDNVTGVFEWVESSIFAVVVVILLFTFALRIVGIDGRSMVPTLQNADRVVISNLFYTPKTGDIVVLDTNEDTIYFNGRQYSKPLIKRVIATGGQTVKVTESVGGVQTVYVDGVALNEDYINFETVSRSGSQEEITVPEGSIFVMGDNRGESLDSRIFGCISEDTIVGRALFRIYPISEFGTLN